MLRSCAARSAADWHWTMRRIRNARYFALEYTKFAAFELFAFYLTAWLWVSLTFGYSKYRATLICYENLKWTSWAQDVPRARTRTTMKSCSSAAFWLAARQKGMRPGLNFTPYQNALDFLCVCLCMCASVLVCAYHYLCTRKLLAS